MFLPGWVKSQKYLAAGQHRDCWWGTGRPSNPSSRLSSPRNVPWVTLQEFIRLFFSGRHWQYLPTWLGDIIQNYKWHQEVEHWASAHSSVLASTDLNSKEMLSVKTGLRLLNILNERKYMSKVLKLHRATQNKLGIIIVAFVVVVILKAWQVLEQITNTKDQGKNRNKKDPNRRDLITQKLFRWNLSCATCHTSVGWESPGIV